MVSSLPSAVKVMLRSQAGPRAGAWLRAIPSDSNISFTPQYFILALRRRLRLRLPLTGARDGNHGIGFHVSAELGLSYGRIYCNLWRNKAKGTRQEKAVVLMI